jgi:hypothetical protein
VEEVVMPLKRLEEHFLALVGLRSLVDVKYLVELFQLEQIVALTVALATAALAEHLRVAQMAAFPVLPLVAVALLAHSLLLPLVAVVMVQFLALLVAPERQEPLTVPELKKIADPVQNPPSLFSVKFYHERSTPWHQSPQPLLLQSQ